MGRMLDLSTNELDSISRKTLNENSESCWCVFSRWIDSDHTSYPPTWKGLYDLLCDVQKVTVANTMKDALATYGVHF